MNAAADKTLPVPRTLERRLLTSEQFRKLSVVPAETEWFANIKSAGTRRIYKIDIRDFMGFVGIVRPEEFRTVTRAHVIAYRDELRSEEHTSELQSPCN